MPSLDLALVLMAAAVGGAVQSVVGFGVAFTTVPVLAAVAPELLPGAALAGFLPMTVVMALRERSTIRHGEAGLLMLARLPGTALGAAAVAAVSARSLAAAVAVVLLVAVVAAARGWSVSPTPRTLRTVGVISGFTGTATGLGGPPMALVYRGEGGAVMRPTLAAVFAVGIVTSLALLAVTGSFVGGQALVGLWIGAATMAGLVVASPLLRRLREERLRQLLLLWAAVGSLLALVQVVAG